jgi:hypothetical protein
MDEVLKLKRQVRDWLNKNVHDTATLLQVAEVIKYPVQTENGSECTKHKNNK